MEIVVTDKRVYGKTAFGKRVDLPLDSISSISTGAMKGIAVATSSGRIRFWFIKNNEEVHGEVSKLLIGRQNKKTLVSESLSGADELIKYKELLDSGVLTQEEFEAKKKEVLNL